MKTTFKFYPNQIVHKKSTDKLKPKESIFEKRAQPKQKKEKQVIKMKKRMSTKRDSAQRDHKIIPHSWPHQPEGRPEHALKPA